MAKKKQDAEEVEEVDGEAGEQKRLPQMEDAAIEDIENAALAYAKARDRRMSCTDDEVNKKELLLAVLKNHDKMTYYRHTKKGTIDVKRVPKGEKLKVRITDED